jgi:cysteine desulfurase
MGFEPEVAQTAVRFSFAADVSESDATTAPSALAAAVSEVRGIVR